MKERKEINVTESNLGNDQGLIAWNDIDTGVVLVCVSVRLVAVCGLKGVNYY